jgi:hypothetical protein
VRRALGAPEDLVRDQYRASLFASCAHCRRCVLQSSKPEPTGKSQAATLTGDPH